MEKITTNRSVSVLALLSALLVATSAARLSAGEGRPAVPNGLPAPPYSDHTQYRSVVLKHHAADVQFEYSGTNGFTARIEAAAPADS